MLSLRQKILIGLTFFAGLVLVACSTFDLLDQYILNQFILFYGIGIPLYLLTFDTVIDLNNKNTFRVWLAISILLLTISMMTFNSDKYIIERSSTFDKSSGINSWLSDHSTSSLKALFIFLLVYWAFNKLLNTKGVFLINTFGQKNWYHNLANRDITGLDVIVNIVLYVVIIAAGLFGY
jgi:hypothetical protein